MRVHWGWVLAGAAFGYFVLPKVVPAIKGQTGAKGA